MKTFTAMSIAAGLALAAPAWAEQGQMQQGMQGMEGMQEHGRAMMQGQHQKKDGRVHVLGKVVETKQVQLKGAAGNQHQLVKLETQQGQRVVADLGTSSEATQVQQGDRLLVVGRSARINDKPVVFAKFFGEMQPAGKSGVQGQGTGQAGAGAQDQPGQRGQGAGAQGQGGMGTR